MSKKGKKLSEIVIFVRKFKQMYVKYYYFVRIFKQKFKGMVFIMGEIGKEQVVLFLVLLGKS